MGMMFSPSAWFVAVTPAGIPLLQSTRFMGLQRAKENGWKLFRQVPATFESKGGVFLVYDPVSGCEYGPREIEVLTMTYDPQQGVVYSTEK